MGIIAIMPIVQSTRLALVLPGLRRRVQQGDSFPSLERLLAFSDDALTVSGLTTHDPWQVDVLDALALSHGASNSIEALASAAVSWVGMGGERLSGTWFHLDPVIMSMATGGV